MLTVLQSCRKNSLMIFLLKIKAIIKLKAEKKRFNDARIEFKFKRKIKTEKRGRKIY